MPKNALVESISTRICDKKTSITAAQCFDENIRDSVLDTKDDGKIDGIIANNIIYP